MEKCARCGREAPQYNIVDGLCQWHRGSDSRHRRKVNKLIKGGAWRLSDIRKKRKS